MITLKIKKPGFIVDIPGVPTCRSPVEVDISKLDIRVVAMFLKTSGITDYEIVADIGKGVKEVYTKKDFEAKEPPKSKRAEVKDIDKRFNKLENMLSLLLEQKQDSLKTKKEQTIVNPTVQTFKGKESEIEEFEAFIPDVDINKMKIESKNLKIVKQESKDLDDSADLLSSLIKK